MTTSFQKTVLAHFAAASLLAPQARAGDESRLGDARLSGHRHPATPHVDPVEPASIDPADIFEQLVERYQELATYEDTVVIEQITARDGERAVRTETTVNCLIDDEGELEITTPTSQMSGGFDLLGLFDGNHPARQFLEQQYQLWLAPHLALKYLAEPLSEFREGVDEGFTPAKAERVTIADEELVRLDLQSGDGLSEDYRARFEIFIHPQTLLIKRVRGVQLLPDGANLLTDFQITPRTVTTSDGRDLLFERRIGAAT